VRSVTKWVFVTIGLTALWVLTRAVVFYFVGVIAVFATAFQATVNALSRVGSDAAQEETTASHAPELRIQRDARLAPSIVDLTAAESPQHSAV
jgi:hypothetical protein